MTSFLGVYWVVVVHLFLHDISFYLFRYLFSLFLLVKAKQMASFLYFLCSCAMTYFCKPVLSFELIFWEILLDRIYNRFNE